MPTFSNNLSVDDLYLIEDGLEQYVFDQSIGDNIRVYIKNLGTTLFPVRRTYDLNENVVLFKN